MADIFDLFKKIEKPSASTGAAVTHLVVGLGNPGDKYLYTRHNAGFLTIDYIAEKNGVKIDRSRFKALTCDAVIGGKRVLLMKPQTYMNNSGEAVVEAMNFYKIPLENILVFSDDISMDVGRVRMRLKGSDGGQKGLRSIIRECGSDNFPRIKFGVGAKPHPDYDLADWVLSEFTPDDQKKLFPCFERAYDGVVKFLEGDRDGAVAAANRAPETAK